MEQTTRKRTIDKDQHQQNLNLVNLDILRLKECKMHNGVE